jgi:hypothetical protein
VIEVPAASGHSRAEPWQNGAPDDRGAGKSTVRSKEVESRFDDERGKELRRRRRVWPMPTAVARADRAELDGPLSAAIATWLAADWPFESVNQQVR